MQIALKIVFSLIIVGLSIWALRWLWLRDIDVQQLLRPDKAIIRKMEETMKKMVPVREEDALYQGNRIVARVEGATVDKVNKVVSFREIHHSGNMDLSEPVVFQKYKLELRHIDTLINLDVSAPEKGRILRGVRFELLGPA